MSDNAINVERLSKQYQIRQQVRRDRGLRHAIQDAASAPWRWVRGRTAGDGTAQSGANTRGDKPFEALKDVTFDVGRGEVVGIVGRNGAGKSTLLKILSRITEPTEGRVRLRGRVASLLEVGTGFHPELTGRENVFLNGAILGMTRKEIQRKLDEIVAFSGVEKFLDMPVKRYSSGMHVRLAFSVAAHLEPEMLLVDEVLAVGDAEFQRKCLGKMRDVTQHGRTVLFVSHNMAAIRNLCPRVILLEQGSIAADGPAAEVVGRYLQRDLRSGAEISGAELDARVQRGSWGGPSPNVLLCHKIALLDVNDQPRSQFESEEPITVEVTYECRETHNDFRLVLSIGDEDNSKVLTTQSADDRNGVLYSLPPGLYRSRCTIPGHLFGERTLYLSVWLVLPHVDFVAIERALTFDTRFAGYNNIQYMSYKESMLRPRLPWQTERLDDARVANCLAAGTEVG